MLSPQEANTLDIIRRRISDNQYKGDTERYLKFDMEWLVSLIKDLSYKRGILYPGYLRHDINNVHARVYSCNYKDTWIICARLLEHIDDLTQEQEKSTTVVGGNSCLTMDDIRRRCENHASGENGPSWSDVQYLISIIDEFDSTKTCPPQPDKPMITMYAKGESDCELCSYVNDNLSFYYSVRSVVDVYNIMVLYGHQLEWDVKLHRVPIDVFPARPPKSLAEMQYHIQHNSPELRRIKELKSEIAKLNAELAQLEKPAVDNKQCGT